MRRAKAHTTAGWTLKPVCRAIIEVVGGMDEWEWSTCVSVCTRGNGVCLVYIAFFYVCFHFLK